MDDAWSVILELKDIVELLASSTFKDESLFYPWYQNKQAQKTVTGCVYRAETQT